MAGFSNEMGKLFRSMRIGEQNEAELATDLATDSAGAVVVRGDLSDKETIERALAERPNLADRMRAISGLARLLRAAEEARESRRRSYKSDPAAADSLAHDGSTHTGSAEIGSNIVRLTVPSRN